MFYLSIMALYFIMGIFYSLKKTVKLSSVVQIMVAFMILHFSYGTGYLNGIVDFLIFNTKPNPKHTYLSR